MGIAVPHAIFYERFVAARTNRPEVFHPFQAFLGQTRAEEEG